jgi:hypothetical protein
LILQLNNNLVAKAADEARAITSRSQHRVTRITRRANAKQTAAEAILFGHPRHPATHRPGESCKGTPPARNQSRERPTNHTSYLTV